MLRQRRAEGRKLNPRVLCSSAYVSALFTQDICRLPYYECPHRTLKTQHSRHSDSCITDLQTPQRPRAPQRFSCLFGLPCGPHNKCQIQFSGVMPGVRINYLGKLHFFNAHAPIDLTLESLQQRHVSCPPRNAFVLICLKVIKLNLSNRKCCGFV